MMFNHSANSDDARGQRQLSHIEREKRTVAQMIDIYARNHPELDAEELKRYTAERLDRCPHGESKGECRCCPTHCYSPSHRELIRAVMRYVGPRMIFYSPLAALRHLLGR